jgi:hypothetical protein
MAGCCAAWSHTSAWQCYSIGRIEMVVGDGDDPGRGPTWMRSTRGPRASGARWEEVRDAETRAFGEMLDVVGSSTATGSISSCSTPRWTSRRFESRLWHEEAVTDVLRALSAQR